MRWHLHSSPPFVYFCVSLLRVGRPYSIIEDLVEPKLQVLCECIVVLSQLVYFFFLPRDMLFDGFERMMTHLALNCEAHDDTMLVLVGNPELFFHGQLPLGLRLEAINIAYFLFWEDCVNFFFLLHIYDYSAIDESILIYKIKRLLYRYLLYLLIKITR